MITMFDKLVLLCPLIRRPIETIALEHGSPTAGYERCVDLRKTSLELPVRLFLRGRYNRIHKAELIGVSHLGLPRTKEIVESIFPDLESVKMYRVDLCVDLMGHSPWFFVMNTRVPRRQNYALYRSRGAVSFYLEFSKQHKIVFYDRLRLLRKQKDPLADLYGADDQLTRIEIQFAGAAVPFKRFAEICRYGEIEPLRHVHFTKLRVETDDYTAVQRLAAYGLRWLITKYGLQPTARMFTSPEWAALKKVYLERMQESEMPRIGLLMRKSIRRWLEGRILYPRVRSRKIDKSL